MAAEALQPDGSLAPARPVGPIEKLFLAANRWIVIAMMAAMVVMVFANVVSRYVWNYSFIWAEELSQYLMVWITFLGAGLALREGRHVAVELLQDRLPVRTRAWVRHLVAALIIVFLLALVVLGFQFALFAWEQETPVMNIPLGIPYLAVPLGALLLLVHIGFIYRAFVDNRLEYPESLEAPVDEGGI
ncbi:MAG TPA: TRAP transporter small permease [Noviherbaspirillum sp.]|jgi:TRAP-type C4-dicarboxylate transport system permease small subunit|uniref:TRAP transporter small permease n=1 Tax=Noviherbaspirillum sp. TaxID=1926288 RepID=UPI002F9270E0